MTKKTRFAILGPIYSSHTKGLMKDSDVRSVIVRTEVVIYESEVDRFIEEYPKIDKYRFLEWSKRFRCLKSEDTKKGRKGNKQIRDYIIPVITLMKKHGRSHETAYKEIAKKLGVSYSTVNSQCTRALKIIGVEEFERLVNNGQILNILYDRYPEQKNYIKQELENLYSKQKSNV